MFFPYRNHTGTVSTSTAEDRICICNAPNYRRATSSGSDVVKEPDLFSRGATCCGFHLQRYELSQVTDLAVTDQVGAADA
jgi:hypothetical protein